MFVLMMLTTVLHSNYLDNTFLKVLMWFWLLLVILNLCFVLFRGNLKLNQIDTWQGIDLVLIGFKLYYLIRLETDPDCSNEN